MHSISLIAYDISPYRGSEASVSWNFVTKMSNHVHLTVYYASDRDEIKQYLSQHESKNVDWVHIPTTTTTKTGLAGHLSYMRHYSRWQKNVYKAIQAKAKDGGIDLIHYLNPIGFKEPGYCWKIKEIPYVWGPIACVENRPIPLYKAYSLKGVYNALSRRIIHNLLFRLMPRLKQALRRTDIVFAATPTGVRLLKKIHHREAIYLPENGIMRMERTAPITYDGIRPINMVWIGRVNDQDKALVIMLEALKKAKSSKYHLHIIGPGAPSARINELASTLKGNVTFHGKLEREQVQQLIADSHLHVITSLGEGNPTVIWEAMAKGVPTLTLDHCGMSGVVCNRCGIKIPVGSYRKVTARIANEIDHIIEHPTRINELSTGVLACSERFMWENRIPLFIETYARLINEYKPTR